MAQITNTSATKRAIILLKSDQIAFTKYELKPRNGMNTSFEGMRVDIQIVYEESTASSLFIDIMNFIKEQVRKQVTKENGELKSTIFGIQR